MEMGLLVKVALGGQLPKVSTFPAGCVNLEVSCLVHRILRLPESKREMMREWMKQKYARVTDIPLRKRAAMKSYGAISSGY